MKKILLVLMVCLASTAQAQTRFIRNTGLATLQGTDLEPSSAAVGSKGNVYTSLFYDSSIGSSGPVRLEGSTSADGNSGFASLYTINTTSAVKSTDGTFTSPALDTAGRTITAAAASSSLVVGCNTAVTTATTGQVIAAVASNFTFITTLSCTNTGAAATRVILEDGDGTDLANVMLAATTGFATISFETPVKTNVVNRAIQINVITTSSSTICCASGYTGII